MRRAGPGGVEWESGRHGHALEVSCEPARQWRFCWQRGFGRAERTPKLRRRKLPKRAECHRLRMEKLSNGISTSAVAWLFCAGCERRSPNVLRRLRRRLEWRARVRSLPARRRKKRKQLQPATRQPKTGRAEQPGGAVSSRRTQDWK